MRKDLILVSLMVAIIALMIVPLDQLVIDTLLAINLSLSVLLLMVAIYLTRPSDFSTLPSVILIGTAFRLALSIGTTRLILSEADAGQIIATFGDFVVRGSIAIGLVIFLIITVVQFLVVTKGSERVAEVAARFALDAMPGKQMSIDADARAGAITEAEAAAKRSSLDKDSQFFGAMDGAMKFVKGDAIAGLVIILINLVGGIAVGMSVHGYSFSEAFGIFALLTVGDGLVAQIPALLMAFTAGTIVTRVSKDDQGDLGSDIVKELVADPKVPGVAAFVVLLFGLIPGFPFLIFAIASMILLTMSVLARRILLVGAIAADEQAEKTTSEGYTDNVEDDPLDGVTISDRIGLKITPTLASTLDLAAMRAEMRTLMERSYARYGINFPVPFIQVAPNPREDTSFTVDLDDVPIQRGTAPSRHRLTDARADVLREVGCDPNDMPKVEWVTLNGYWVPERFAEDLTQLGAASPDLGLELVRLCYRHKENNIGTLFGSQEFEALLEVARQHDAKSMALIDEKLGTPALMQVFRYLLEDGVPLRPMRLLVDSLAHWTVANKDAGPVVIAECMRGSLRRQLCQVLATHEGVLGVAMLAPDLQADLLKSISKPMRSAEPSRSIDGLMLEPELNDHLVREFRRVQYQTGDPTRLMTVVAPLELRRRLRNFLASNDINLPVLSAHEISPDIQTFPIELIKKQEHSARRPASTAPPASKPQVRRTLAAT